jgi:hypothetical protein
MAYACGACGRSKACDAAVRCTAVLNSLLSHVDPGPRVKGFEGIAPLMCPCCVEDVTGTEGPALAGNVPTSQLLPLCLMMRTVCVWVGCVPSAARTPFPVIGSCVKISELIFNTPRRHQLAAQTYHTLRPIIGDRPYSIGKASVAEPLLAAVVRRLPFSKIGSSLRSPGPLPSSPLPPWLPPPPRRRRLRRRCEC